jgi:hypothetical protein
LGLILANMLYVGITVYFDEARRLLCVPPDLVADIYNSGRADEYIAARTSLRVFALDKGVCVLGLEVREVGQNLWAPVRSVDECVALIQVRKYEWLLEVARLRMDLSEVTLAHMEDEDEVVENPQPALLMWVR